MKLIKNTDSKKYSLVRYESGSASLERIENPINIQPDSRYEYSIVAGNELTPLELLFGARIGNDLVITLENGISITITDYFLNENSDTSFFRWKEDVDIVINETSNNTAEFVSEPVESIEENNDETRFSETVIYAGAGLVAGFLLNNLNKGSTNNSDIFISDREVAALSLPTENPNASGEVSIRKSYSVSENKAFTGDKPDVLGSSLVSWSISGSDSQFFVVDPISGVVTMTAKDYEKAVDANNDSIYEFKLIGRTADEKIVTSENIEVAVLDITETTEITVPESVYRTVHENKTLSIDIAEPEQFIGKLSWSLRGKDAQYFSVNKVNGTVTFAKADFERPVDFDKDNSYEVFIDVTDSDDNTATTALTVAVTNTYESNILNIISQSRLSLPENSEPIVLRPVTQTASLGLQWSIRGEDAEFFTINTNTGELNFLGKDYETPLDNDSNNIYEAELFVQDADGNVASQDIAFEVTDTPNEDIPTTPTTPTTPIIIPIPGTPDTEVEPEFALQGVFRTSIREGKEYKSPIHSLSTEVSDLSWDITGVDSDELQIDEFGRVSFRPTADGNAYRDFEFPSDANLDNVYEYEITATDTSTGKSATKSIELTLIDDQLEILQSDNQGSFSPFPNYYVLREGSEFTSKLPIIDPSVLTNYEGATVSWRLIGDDSELVSVDTDTGIFTQVDLFDFENPKDINLDNQLDFTLVADIVIDGVVEESVASIQNITIEDVADSSNEPIENGNFGIYGITSPTKIKENQNFEPFKVFISGNDNPVSWRLSGPDADLFEISADGSISIINSVERFNHENPLDVDLDNSYQFEIIATEESTNRIDRKAVQVIVQNDALEILTLSGSTFPTTIYLDENSLITLPTPSLATDTDDVVWSLLGEDALRFEIISTNGKISIKSSPDFEIPSDYDKNNEYKIELIASADNEIIERLPISLFVNDVFEADINDDIGNSELLQAYSLTEDGIYLFDEEITINVVFSAPVKFIDNPSTSPSLLLSNGQEATYKSGINTSNLEFSYKVQDSDFISDIDIESFIPRTTVSANDKPLDLQSLSSIENSLIASSSISLDGSPGIEKIYSVPVASDYTPGQTVTILVDIDQDVQITASGDVKPVLALSNGAIATFKEQTALRTLAFDYIVDFEEYQDDLDVIALSENSFIIKNNGGLNLLDSLIAPKFGGLAFNNDINIKAATDSLSQTALIVSEQGTYISGDEIEIVVTFSSETFVTIDGTNIDSLADSVAATGGPILALSSGGTAVYASGSGTNQLRFTYIPEEGESANDLKVLTAARQSSELKNAFGANVSLSIEPQTTESGVEVDAVSPFVTGMVLESPEFDRIETVGGKERQYVKGILRIDFNEKVAITDTDSFVVLSNIDDHTNPSFPELASFVAISDDKKSALYEYEGYLVDELLPIEATAIIENASYIGDLSGNAANTTIILGGNDIAGTQLNAAAGVFISDELGYRITDSSDALVQEGTFRPNSDELLPISKLSQYANEQLTIELIDINGAEADYLDEFTGQDLSLSREGGSSLFASITGNQLLYKSLVGEQLYISPLSDLAYKLTQKSDYPTLQSDAVIASIFNLADLKTNNIEFFTDEEFQPDITSHESLFGMALTVLSILDNHTGSIQATNEQIASQLAAGERSITLTAPNGQDIEFKDAAIVGLNDLDLSEKDLTEFASYIDQIVGQVELISETSSAFDKNALGEQEKIDISDINDNNVWGERSDSDVYESANFRNLDSLGDVATPDYQHVEGLVG